MTEYQEGEEGTFRQHLKGRMKAYFEKVGFSEFEAWKSDCLAKVEKLYPNDKERSKYRLFHILMGVGDLNFDLEKQPYFDFEGEASVQKMIEKLEI